LVELDHKLAAVLSGEQPVSDAAERIKYADLCHKKRLFAAAARFFEQALAEKPELAEDPPGRHRYNAACCAALAASAQGDDAALLDDATRERWRQQALDWLRAELDSWRKLLEGDSAGARAKVIATLKHWQTDSDLAGVRDAEALAKLPEAEREAWGKLWADVAELLKEGSGQ
jgi:hypothetical protein